MTLAWAITGASGFVGSAVTAMLTDGGERVREFRRHPRPGRDDVAFALGEAALAPGALAGIDVVVHCAWDLSLRDPAAVNRINVAGSLRLLEAARAAGVKRFVFISSVSAFPGCRSVYGQAKLAVEGEVLAAEGLVLRPGLVYGDPPRGIVAALERLTALPLLPIFDGGGQPFVLVHAADLARVVRAAGLDSGGGPGRLLAVAHPAETSFKDVLRLLSRRRPRFISVPSAIALGALRITERIGLPLPFRHDSLIGMIHPNPALRCPTEPWGVRLRAFEEWAKSRGPRA
jgi:nucleoside-diphosphate-sugar epimerase